MVCPRRGGCRERCEYRKRRQKASLGADRPLRAAVHCMGGQPQSSTLPLLTSRSPSKKAQHQAALQLQNAAAPTAPVCIARVCHFADTQTVRVHKQAGKLQGCLTCFSDSTAASPAALRSGAKAAVMAAPSRSSVEEAVRTLLPTGPRLLLPAGRREWQRYSSRCGAVQRPCVGNCSFEANQQSQCCDSSFFPHRPGVRCPAALLRCRAPAFAQIAGEALQAGHTARTGQHPPGTRSSSLIASSSFWILRIGLLSIGRAYRSSALALVTAPPPMPAQAGGARESGTAAPPTKAAAAAPSSALRSTPPTFSSCRAYDGDANSILG